MNDIYEEIARSYYNRSSDQIMSNEQKHFFDNLTLIRILDEKNKELQYKINRAVEYLEELKYKSVEYGYFTYGEDLHLQSIIDILKGDNK